MPPRAKTGPERGVRLRLRTGWRLCGPLGMLRRPMGRLSATVCGPWESVKGWLSRLGVWAQEHLGHWEAGDKAKSRVAPGGALRFRGAPGGLRARGRQPALPDASAAPRLKARVLRAPPGAT